MKISSERLKALRDAKGLSQTEVGKAIGCNQKTYSQYELRQRDISTDMLCCIADFFGVSTDYLLGRTDNPKPPKSSEM